MATLIYSTRMHSRDSILTYDPMAGIDHAIDKLIDTVFSKPTTAAAANRLVIQNGRYMYTPSNEYTKVKSRFIRAKFNR